MTRDEEVLKVNNIFRKINKLLVGERLSVCIEALQYSLACNLALILTGKNQEMIDYVLKSSHEEIEHLERIMREDIKVGVDEREIAKSFLEEIKEQYVDREAELKEELNIAQG